MRKLVKLGSVVLAAVCLLAFVSCGKKEDDPEIVVGNERLYISGSLQQLYGGDDGYPQAVMVAKKSFVESYPEFTSEFIDKLHHADEYLNNASAEEIVSAISSKLTKGLTPAFNKKNLTPEVVKNCNVKFVSAQEEKENVREVLLGMMGEKAPKTADEFFYSPFGIATQFTSQSAESKNLPDRNVTVYTPDGAPALSLTELITEKSELIAYNVVEASTIQKYVTNTDESKNADFCIMPVNLAAKLLGNADKYQMIGTVTHGNLFILSKNESGTYNEGDTLKDLVGKRVGVVQLPNVPGMVFKMILNRNNVPFQTLENGAEIAADKVNLVAVSADQVLADSPFEAFIVAEPLATLRTLVK